MTTSDDKLVRVWCVNSGKLINVLADSCSVPVAVYIPLDPQSIVAANSDTSLSLWHVHTGQIIQRLQVDAKIRALTFDDGGRFLFAGTTRGSIDVLEYANCNTGFGDMHRFQLRVKFNFEVNDTISSVTCITFVPASHGRPPSLLVSTSDGAIVIIECSYVSPSGVLASLASLSVRHTLRMAKAALPLRCCYSPSFGPGYLISGSGNNDVSFCSLARDSNYTAQRLTHHQETVVAVATNMQDTLLASGDVSGRIVIWRRIDFSDVED